MTTTPIRGADLLIQSLKIAGTKYLFTLSGNQVMPIFDASIDSGVELIHVRHEAAAVHMADAWGRLTGLPGMALVTAGPGLANTLSALYVAQMAESPLVLISGHAPRANLGRGAFQEMAQADMARHVTKASWTLTETTQIGFALARAFRLATSARPGPVHLSIPFDVLQATVENSLEVLPILEDFRAMARPPDDADVEQIVTAIGDAIHPLILAGPALTRGPARLLLSQLEDELSVPVIGMESPRGINDPSLGAVAEILPQADLIVLLGKKLDFTLPARDHRVIQPSCRLIQIDAEPSMIEQTKHVLEDPAKMPFCFVEDPVATGRGILRLFRRPVRSDDGFWAGQVRRAIEYRPPEWRQIESSPGGPLHAVEICRIVQRFLDGGTPSILISDGGEFGQWVQACNTAQHRLINGPSGSIGSAIPFGLAARLAFPKARIVNLLGDGTFGFHAMEFDTAVRYNLPCLTIVGNDAAWNAELQIQLKQYGAKRAIGCELLPARYDDVVRALGGFGQQVSTARQLEESLEQADQSGLPACLNVRIDRIAAPIIRRNEQPGYSQ